MSLISKTFTYTAGSAIVASEHNTNNDTLFNEINGNLDNANIKASAGIVDTKLAQITTAGKVSGAALTTINSTPTGAGALPTKNGGTAADFSATAQGSTLYFSAAGVISALAVGTSGQFLKTQGAAANPVWASTFAMSVLDYGSSASASTERGTAGSTLKVCYGSVALIAGSIVISNLPYTSSTSYTIVGILDTDAGTQSQAITVARTSLSSATFTDSQGTTKKVHFIAIGI